MEKLPDITMAPEEEIGELDGDIKVVEQMEDLKADPFIRAEPIKPEMVVEEKPVKAKRQVSEKQKLHLANARKAAREKKALAKKQQNTKVEPNLPAPPVAPNDGMEDEIKEQKKYMDWLDNMGKYNQMMSEYKKQQEEEAEKALKKEKELEAKYFKKFKEQHNPPQREEIKEEVVLKQGFGEYSNYF